MIFQAGNVHESASQFGRRKLIWKTVGFEPTTQKIQYMYTTLTSKTTEVLKCPKGLRSMGSNDDRDITSDSMLTITNPESHAHPPFVNAFTMLLYKANAVNILSVALPHVHDSVNCYGSWTLCAVESEIPSFATRCTLTDFKGTGPGNKRAESEMFL